MSAAHTEPESVHLLEAEDVREELGLTNVQTVYRLARSGRIGGVVRLGRLLRFDPVGLREWIRAGGTRLEK